MHCDRDHFEYNFNSRIAGGRGSCILSIGWREYVHTLACSTVNALDVAPEAGLACLRARRMERRRAASANWPKSFTPWGPHKTPGYTWKGARVSCDTLQGTRAPYKDTSSLARCTSSLQSARAPSQGAQAPLEGYPCTWKDCGVTYETRGTLRKRREYTKIKQYVL